MAGFLSDSVDNSRSHVDEETRAGFDSNGSIVSCSSITNSIPRNAEGSANPMPIVVDKLKPRSGMWTTFKVYKDKELDRYAHCTIRHQRYFTHLITALV
jgi:hypothetical protein